MEAYLDIKNKKLHIGDMDAKSYQNKSGAFISYPAVDDQWQIKIRDIRYDSKSANFTSLNDTFTRNARLDTAFPGVAVPHSLWPNVKTYLLGSIKLPENSALDCGNEQPFLGENYHYCSIANTTCEKLTLGDISLQFSGFEAYTYPSSSYATTRTHLINETINMTFCDIQLFGNQDLEEDYYMLGDRFMQNYYILFNYTNNSVGFNGPYYTAEQIIDKPDYVPEAPVMPLWAVILIACVVVGIVLAICVCLYIRQKNNSLRSKLNDNYDTLSPPKESR